MLNVLMRKKPLYSFAQLTLIGGMCSASICSVSFSGSFVDCLASAPLGALLVAVQLIGVRNELYANVFEITIATLLSFLSAALASTKHFCYSAVASSSVVLILPVSTVTPIYSLDNAINERIRRALLCSADPSSSRRVPWSPVPSDYVSPLCTRFSWASGSRSALSCTRGSLGGRSLVRQTICAWTRMTPKGRGGSGRRACGGRF